MMRRITDRERLQTDVTRALEDWAAGMAQLEKRGVHPLVAIEQTRGGAGRRSSGSRVIINELTPGQKAMDRAMTEIRDWLGERCYRSLECASRGVPIAKAAELLRISAIAHRTLIAEGRAWLACMISRGQI